MSGFLKEIAGFSAVCGDVIYSPFGLDKTVWFIILLVLIMALMTAAVVLAVRFIRYIKASKKDKKED